MARSVFGITRVINLYSSKYHADRDYMVKSLFWRCAQVGHKRLDLKSCVSLEDPWVRIPLPPHKLLIIS